MEFKVKFVAFSSTRLAIDVGGERQGLRSLDRIREELNLPDLDPKLVETYSKKLRIDPTIALTEDEARESNQFENTNFIKVIVDKSSLNDFAKSYLVVDKDSRTGEIKDINTQWAIDRDALFEWWKSKGFPLEIEEEKQENEEQKQEDEYW